MPKPETVRIRGKDVPIRTDSTDPSREILDYGTKLWWIEEGFPGTYTVTQKDRSESGHENAAGFEIKYNGEVTLRIGGNTYSGRVKDTRYFAELAEVELFPENGQEPFALFFDCYVNDDLTEDPDRIEINMPDAPDGIPNDLFMTRE